jgi:hypothetical protein
MLDQKETVNTSEFNSTEGRTIPVPTDSFNSEWFEKYAHIADENIQVGDPATYSCGSDSYADVVTSVVRFKEGKRAGQVKYITLRDGDKFNAYPIKCTEHSTPKIAQTEPEVIDTPWGGTIIHKASICIKCWLQAHNALHFTTNADTYWVSVRVGSQNPQLDPHF